VQGVVVREQRGPEARPKVLEPIERAGVRTDRPGGEHLDQLGLGGVEIKSADQSAGKTRIVETSRLVLVQER